MSEASVLADLAQLLEGQTAHGLLSPVELREREPDAEGRWWVQIGDAAEWASIPEIVAAVEERERWIALSEQDRFAHGFWLPAWEENLWEIAKLRVENPGEPISFLCAGSNGSGKSEFAAALLIRAMMQTDDLPRRKAEKPVFWCLAETEPKSIAVQQPKAYAWLPLVYKPEKGSIKKNARGKLGYSDAGGFTDNAFSLYHGTICRFRFWSATPDTVLEGPRPMAVWSDEELPFYWLEQIEKRLLTEAELSKAVVPALKVLLEQRERDPSMPFPKGKVQMLVMGLHLLTYTAKNGYTDTVRAFMDKARVVREIEADAELLPRRNESGEIVGGERMPKLVHCALPHRRVRFMHAWENPLGGNWEVMRKQAKAKGRAEILWWCYGVAEKSADTPVPNFDVRMHVRPKNWLPRVGTWYHIVDPNATGGRQWFMLWALVCGEHWNELAPGDIWIPREWPQRNDVIPGIGMPGEWAMPGGKGGQGLRGPAQQAWPVGLQWRSDEIKRVERELAMRMGWPAARVDSWEDMQNFIPEGNRIMDVRPLNTAIAGQVQAKTLYDHMADNELYFYGSGRDTGAAVGETNVRHGLQLVNDAFWFDRDLAVLNEKTGWLEISPQKGRGPRLRISEECENLIDSLLNLPGEMKQDCPWKDPIDCLRYLVLADPWHEPEGVMDERKMSRRQRSEMKVGGAW